VVLQRPIKHRFRTQFNLWQSQQVACQVLNGVQPNNIELQLGIRELRGQVVGWMMAAWDEVAALQDMIRKGWAKCRLGEIHKLEFQSKALTECLTKGLLAAQETVAEDTLAGPEGDSEVLVSSEVQQASAATVMEACLGDEEGLDVPSDVDLYELEDSEDDE
jgi:hypothetical protein